MVLYCQSSKSEDTMESGVGSAEGWKKRMLKRCVESSCSSGSLVTVQKPKDFLLNRSEEMIDKSVSDPIINSSCANDHVLVLQCPVVRECANDEKANICSDPTTKHPKVILISHSLVTNSNETSSSETQQRIINYEEYDRDVKTMKCAVASGFLENGEGRKSYEISHPCVAMELCSVAADRNAELASYNNDERLDLSVRRNSCADMELNSDPDNEKADFPNRKSFKGCVSSTSDYMEVVNAGAHIVEELPSSTDKTAGLSFRVPYLELSSDSECESVELSVSTSDGELSESVHSLQAKMQTISSTGYVKLEFSNTPSTLLSDMYVASAKGHRVENLPGSSSHKTKDLSPYDYVELSSDSEVEGEKSSLEQSSACELNMPPKTVPSYGKKQCSEMSSSALQQSEQVEDETSFPSCFEGLVSVGKYTPAEGKFTPKSGVSLLQTPSLVTPLLFKEPDKFPHREKGVKTKNKDLFSSAAGEFLIGLGLSRASEWYHRETIREKKLQIRKEGKSQILELALEMHQKSYAEAKKANQPFSHSLKSCSICKFVTESAAVLEDHRLVVHVTPGGEYCCSFCSRISFSSQDMLKHMQLVHGKIGRLESPLPLYTCRNCTYQSNSLIGFRYHISHCRNTFNSLTNQAPPEGYEFPGLAPKPASIVAVKLLEKPTLREEVRGGRADYLPGTCQQTPGDSITRNRLLIPNTSKSNLQPPQVGISSSTRQTQPKIYEINPRAISTTTLTTLEEIRRRVPGKSLYALGPFPQTKGDCYNRNRFFNLNTIQSNSLTGIKTRVVPCQMDFNRSSGQEQRKVYIIRDLNPKPTTAASLNMLEKSIVREEEPKEIPGKAYHVPETFPPVQGDSNNRNGSVNQDTIQSNSPGISKNCVLLRRMNFNSRTAGTITTEKSVAYIPRSLPQTLRGLNNTNVSDNHNTTVPRTILHRVSGTGHFRKVILLPPPGTQNRPTLQPLQLPANIKHAVTFSSFMSKSVISKQNIKTATSSAPEIQHSTNRPLPKLQGPLPVQFKKTHSDTKLQNKKLIVCEICDGYVKDLKHLRSHMEITHKVKIHPKRLASRPQLNCGKCDWLFYTDQGLERHLLTVHGIITPRMQELVNNRQDGGCCALCGGIYRSKLVAHVNQIHKLHLEPAKLLYKCKICSSSFDLFGSFENHVRLVHGGAAKRPSESNDIFPKRKITKLSHPNDGSVKENEAGRK